MPSLQKHFDTIRGKISGELNEVKRYGKVSSIIGTIIECTGLEASVGEVYGIHTVMGTVVPAEVVGLKEGKTLLMPYDRVVGMKAGCKVESMGQSLNVPVGFEMLGRVVDTNAEPIDNKGSIRTTGQMPVHNDPPRSLRSCPY